MDASESVPSSRYKNIQNKSVNIALVPRFRYPSIYIYILFIDVFAVCLSLAWPTLGQNATTLCALAPPPPSPRIPSCAAPEQHESYDVFRYRSRFVPMPNAFASDWASFVFFLNIYIYIYMELYRLYNLLSA